MRLLLATVAFLALSTLLGALSAPSLDPAILFFFVVTLQVSHYFITACAKAWLGPRWYSWPLDNRLHHIAASAYSWGWARFLPWSTWRRVIDVVRRFERPLQVAVFALEALSPLALLDRRLAVVFCVAWSLFHLGVFALSGLLFWDWMWANLTVAGALIVLPHEVAARAFGPVALLAGVVFMVVFPLRHKLVRPMPLGWWDTPFTQRIHWRARGESGAVYGLYADFFAPHERLFGKVNGCYLAPVPVMTYHLGEVWNRELRDALREAGPDSDALDRVRARFGIEPRSQALANDHVRYLRRLLHRINAGAHGHVLPRWLRWLAAPGGQIFYWGDLPAYRGQEPVVEVCLIYREEYFDGEVLRRVRDEPVLSIPIDATCADVAPVRAPTPKEIDDLLLGHAVGKLIVLPDFGDGFVHGDDGRPRESVARPVPADPAA